jgi:hypothetical protein
MPLVQYGRYQSVFYHFLTHFRLDSDGAWVYFTYAFKVLNIAEAPCKRGFFSRYSWQEVSSILAGEHLPSGILAKTK